MSILSKRSFLASAVAALALLSLCPGSAGASPVTPDSALFRAREFLAQRHIRRVAGNRQPELAFTLDRDAGASGMVRPMLYVFGMKDSEGFVVVAGDDAAPAILGYSDQGSALLDEMPCNLRAWLSSYADEIAWAQAHGWQPRQRKAANAGKADVPYLITTFWDQKAPYYNDCRFEDEYCYTGCAATTMAQLMYFWATVGADGRTHRPGAKAIARYITRDKEYDVPALPAVSVFDWDEMIPGRRYDSWLEWPWTEANEAAVAKLMRYCGQSVQMNYTPSGSGAYTTHLVGALQHYFGFDKGTRLIKRDTMTAESWEEAVYAELAAGRPVAMSGQDEVENIGHEFICDGYDAATGLYHFNWGWSGYCDSYFELEALSPGGTGSGGTDSDMGSYNAKRDAIILLQPSLTSDEPAVAESATFEVKKDLGIYPSGQFGPDSVMKNGITITAWPYATFASKQQYRVFSGSTLSVAAASGVITKVVFTCTAKNDRQYGPGCFGYPSLGTYSYDGYVGTWEGRAPEFFITAVKDHVRIIKIEVTVEPQTSLLGDANGDGYINMTDVTAVISYVLGAPPADFVFGNADTNADGYINMTDATDIINIILGKQTDD